MRHQPFRIGASQIIDTKYGAFQMPSITLKIDGQGYADK
jgi:hypothetical protein